MLSARFLMCEGTLSECFIDPYLDTSQLSTHVFSRQIINAFEFEKDFLGGVAFWGWILELPLPLRISKEIFTLELEAWRSKACTVDDIKKLSSSSGNIPFHEANS
jgi:hypothetical protein